jgi:hypothetical protein
VIGALALALLTSAANVVVELSRTPGDRAFIVHESGELARATSTDGSLSRGRYWIASAVHDVAFGGVLVVPDLSVIDAHRFANLADVDVRVEEYDPSLDADAAGTLFGLTHTQGAGNIEGRFDFKPFRVVVGPDGLPVPVLRLWQFADMIYLVDDRVLPVGGVR